MHQHNVRRMGPQCFQAGADGILPLGAARHDGQMRNAGKGRADQRGVTHRLQQIDMAEQGFRGVAHHRLAIAAAAIAWASRRRNESRCRRQQEWQLFSCGAHVTGGAVDVKQRQVAVFLGKKPAKKLCMPELRNFALARWTRSLFCSEKELSSLIFIVIGARWQGVGFRQPAAEIDIGAAFGAEGFFSGV